MVKAFASGVRLYCSLSLMLKSLGLNCRVFQAICFCRGPSQKDAVRWLEILQQSFPYCVEWLKVYSNGLCKIVSAKQLQIPKEKGFNQSKK